MSIDAARENIEARGYALLGRAIDLADKFAAEATTLSQIDVVSPGAESLRSLGHAERDPTKVVLHVDPAYGSGIEIRWDLALHFGCEAEIADAHHILFTFTIADGENGEDVPQKLLEALRSSLSRDVSRPRGNVVKEIDLTIHTGFPEVVVAPRTAISSVGVSIMLEDALGRVSKEIICAYPPGMVLCGPGERLTKTVINIIKESLNQGIRLTGIERDAEGQRWLRVLK